jgi:hypothetical protein
MEAYVRAFWICFEVRNWMAVENEVSRVSDKKIVVAAGQALARGYSRVVNWFMD